MDSMIEGYLRTAAQESEAAIAEAFALSDHYKDEFSTRLQRLGTGFDVNAPIPTLTATPE